MDPSSPGLYLCAFYYGSPLRPASPRVDIRPLNSTITGFHALTALFMSFTSTFPQLYAHGANGRVHTIYLRSSSPPGSRLWTTMTSSAPSRIDLTHTFTVQSFGGIYLLRANKYIKVASATFLFLEILSTLPDEVNLVWPTKFSSAKALFLFNKYSPLVDQIVDFTTIFDLTGNVQLCLKRYTAVSWIYFIGVLQSESILLSRTIALWGWNTYVLALILGGGFGIVALCIYAVYQSNLYVKFPQEDVMHLIGCIPSNFDAWPAVACVTIGETAVIVLTFVRWYQDHSASKAKTNAMFPTMYRDGALAYLVVGVISVVNVIVILFAPPELTSCMEMPLRVVHSTLCTRVLLNLRKSANSFPGNTTLGVQTGAPTLEWELATVRFQRETDLDIDL